MILLVGAPVVLAVLAGFAALSNHHEYSRQLLRWFRNLLLTEVAFLVLLATVGAVYERRASARDRRLHPPPGRLIDIGGYRLHLLCSGEGSPTVVLDYGLIGSYLSWRLVQPEVARFTRVCAYDRAGYGWSDRSPRPRTPDVMVDELHELLEKAGEKPPFIMVGHSMGGFNVITYAHRYPDQVAGAVLVDATDLDQTGSFPWREKLWLRFLEFTAPLGLPRWRGWCAQGSEEIHQAMTAFSCKPRVFRTNYDQVSLFGESARQVRALGKLGNLPLVVISRDPERPARRGEKIVREAEQRHQQRQQDLARLSSNSTYVIAEGSGHGVPQQRPDVVVAGIRKQVEEARGRSSRAF
jgi:pimeloyl-ACP methyl ester carboxylesterase